MSGIVYSKGLTAGQVTEALSGTGLAANQATQFSYSRAPHATGNSHSTNSRAIMCRWPYKTASFKVRSPKIAFSNWRYSYDGSSVLTATVALRASLEYPAGKFHPLLFQGRRDIVISNQGEVLSDPVEVEIPANTQFWVRMYYVTLSGDLTSLPSAISTRSTGWFAIGNPGVAATASITAAAGAITSVTLTNGGSGYTPGSTLDCTIGGGSGASVKAIVGAAGVVEGLSLVSAGTGYSSPTISIPGNASGSIIYNEIPYDRTTSGSLSPISINYGAWAPSAIIGMPTDKSIHRSYIAIGDSITEGYQDDTQSMGWPWRVFNSYQAPFICSARGGASLQVTYAEDSAAWKELALADGCTDAVIMLGINDLQNGRTLSQIQTDYASLVQRLQRRGLTVSLCTITPCTNTDGSTRSFESTRAALNNWIRTKPLGVAYIFETADTVETSRNSGVWKPGKVNTTESSYIHPNGAGYDAIAAAFAAIPLS